MAKKKELTEEQKLAKQKEELIKQYNEQNLGESYLENEPATEEDVNTAKTNFESAQEAFNKRTYTIADKPNALRVATFLKNWNEKYATWEKDQWVGVVKFNNFINDFLAEFAKIEQDLVIDYGALMYLDTLMMRPFGIGLQAAQEMEAMNDEYNKILEVVDDFRNTAVDEQKNIKRIQEVWAAAAAGFRLHYLTEEEKAEFEQSTVLGVDENINAESVTVDTAPIE